VTTTARSLLAPPGNPGGGSSSPAEREWEWALALSLLLLSALLAGASYAPHRARRWLVTASAVAVFGLMAACGGGAGGGSTTGGSNQSQPNPTGTPAGTYTLSVTAKSGSATRSTTLSLTVN
jgi:hypothetical protein